MLSCGLLSKIKGHGIPWCRGRCAEFRSSTSDSSNQAAVETHLVLILSEWGAEVEDFYLAESEQILLSFHQVIKDSANCPQPGPHSLMFSVSKPQAIT